MKSWALDRRVEDMIMFIDRMRDNSVNEDLLQEFYKADVDFIRRFAAIVELDPEPYVQKYESRLEVGDFRYQYG